MKIRFVIDQISVTATLDESGASRDFVSMLPLALELKDLKKREKFGELPRTISEDGQRRYTYDVGDVVYWPPGPHVAVFYAQEGSTLPQPGMIRLGAVDGSAEALAAGSSVHAVIERVD